MRTIEEDTGGAGSDHFVDDRVDDSADNNNNNNNNTNADQRRRRSAGEEEKQEEGDAEVLDQSSASNSNPDVRRKKRRKKKKKERNEDENTPHNPQLSHDKVLRTIFYTRLVSFVLLLATTAFLCFRMHEFMVNYEQEEFEEEFADVSENFLGDFETCVQTRLDIVTDFALDVSTAAGSDWPYATVPNFAERAQSTAKLADVLSLALHPLVENATGWHAYFDDNHEAWIADGLTLLTGDPTLVGDVSQMNIPREMWRIGPGGGFELEDESEGSGPYLPQWQCYPALEAQYSNYNLYSSSAFAGMVDDLMQSGRPVFANSYNLTTTAEGNTVTDGIALAYNLNSASGETYQNDPIVSVLFPVFEKENDQSTTTATTTWESKEKIVGVLLARVYWRTCLPSQLHDGMVSVLASRGGVCKEEFSYEIGTDTSAFLGDGDLHDREYDDVYLTTPEPIAGSGAGGCPYTVTVYASPTYQRHYESVLPIYFAFALGVMFLITSILHFVMSCCVERRRVHLIEKANKSAAVVRNLFPKEVREQVYNEAVSRAHGGGGMDGSSNHQNGSTAIANLYPECTICFGDIAGFTKWSSSRSPIQVFELLEAIYGSFDQIAKRLHVFKIETIGDCYVCATGLPKKQSAHAVIMARFASEALEALQDLIAVDLKDRLGDDTAGLAMRFGMHSGPVTAGVLRGDKSRFQIFGDTVNTSARMESNGTRGKIQVSESTATLLKAAGKEKWLTAREDLVAAKGKGMMQCYWVDIGLKPKTPRATVTKPANGDASESSFTHQGDEIGYSYSSSNTSMNHNSSLSSMLPPQLQPQQQQQQQQPQQQQQQQPNEVTDASINMDC